MLRAMLLFFGLHGFGRRECWYRRGHGPGVWCRGRAGRLGVLGVDHLLHRHTMLRTPETHANWGQLARTLGNGQTLGLLKTFGFVPVVGPIVFSLEMIWQLIVAVIAIRQAPDYTSTWWTVGVAVIGFIAYAANNGIVMAIFV